MDESPEAALAVVRWDELQRVCENPRNDGERRFRRRAYERARDRALMVLAMHGRDEGAAPAGGGEPGPSRSHKPSPRRRRTGPPQIAAA